MRFWITHGVKIFRVDNPHTKPPNFWALADRRGEERGSRRAVPGGGVHPACTRCTGWPSSASRSPTRTSPGAPAKWELHRVRPADRRARRLRPAEPVRQYARHPAREPAARRSGHVRDPRRAGVDDELGVGRVLGIRAVRAPAGPGRQRGVPRTRRSTSCAPATSRPHWPTANRWSRS